MLNTYSSYTIISAFLSTVLIIKHTGFQSYILHILEKTPMLSSDF